MREEKKTDRQISRLFDRKTKFEDYIYFKKLNHRRKKNELDKFLLIRMIIEKERQLRLQSQFTKQYAVLLFLFSITTRDQLTKTRIKSKNENMRLDEL